MHNMNWIFNRSGWSCSLKEARMSGEEKMKFVGEGLGDLYL